jgi:UPF0755 protein
LAGTVKINEIPAFAGMTNGIFMSKKNIIISAILIFALIIASGRLYFEWQINYPISQNSAEKNFIVEKGEGVKEIAADLKKSGLIKSAFYFEIYAWQKKIEKKLQAGEYLLRENMNIPEIIEILAKGEIISNQKKITIIEGWKINDIGEYLQENKIVSVKEFETAAKNWRGENYQYDFLKNLPEKASLEGFLFPDTYFIYEDASAKDIIDKALKNFDKYLDKEMRQEIEKQNKSIFEIITMAALLEKEVRTDEDRKIAAGIFYKRIENEIPLESCATVAYILEEDKRQYSFEDTRIESPYNTYLNKGLPLGPICNPGESAIKAAIWPEESEYNFFLSKEDGETVFSKTLEEHNSAKTKWVK